jgi:hypothetical protein
MRKNRKRSIWEFMLDQDGQLFIIGIIVILVSVSNMLGILENVGWISKKIQVVNLLVLGILALTMGRLIKKTRDDVIDNVISSKGVDVLEFDNVGDVYEYVAKRLSSAKYSVEDITWGSYTEYRTEQDKKSYDHYVKTIEKVCKKSNVMYQEISSLSDEHYFHRSMNLLKRYNYHLSYHDISSVTVPLISYVTIDSEEVVLGFCRIPEVKRPPVGVKYLSIKNREVVNFFRDYHRLIFEQGEKIKEANSIRQDKIDKIKNTMGIK